MCKDLKYKLRIPSFFEKLQAHHLNVKTVLKLNWLICLKTYEQSKTLPNIVLKYELSEVKERQKE